MIATAVGNYPKIANRPGGQRLRQAINQYDSGQITEEQLRQVEDEATKEVLEEQARAGLDLVTDGQIRWDDGQTYFARRIDGFEITGLIRYFDTNTYYRQPIAKAQLKRTGPITVQDFQFASSNSSKPVKPVITGPYTLAKLSLTEHHKSFRDFVLNLAEVLNQEAKALQAAGATIIQIDEPAIVKNKGDWAIFQEAMRAVTAGLSTKLALFTYFGDVTDLPGFFELPFHVFGLDFVMGPSNFNLIPTFTKGKELGLGILDARNVKMETVEHLVSTIKRVGSLVSLDRLHIHPNCGLEFLPRETAYAKLERMVEGIKRAREAT